MTASVPAPGGDSVWKGPTGSLGSKKASAVLVEQAREAKASLARLKKDLATTKASGKAGDASGTRDAVAGGASAAV